jgi:hypothetical protein
VLTFIKIHTQTMTKVFLGFPDLAHVTPNVQTGYGLEQMGGQILQKYYEI